MEALLATFAPGTVLGGRFEIVGELGAGGSATVYLALDKTRQERVALKVLHPHLAGDADNARRLLREVRAASALQHPRALLPYDMHELDGLYALSLPVHDGVSLGEHVQIHGPWTADALERLTLQLCDVLAAAHRRGLLHRDLSPGNVMIDSDGDAMLTDFGLARVAGHQTSTATRAMGTPGFTAPEVYEGRTADPRSDLYGLGGVIYMAATGTRPFSAPSPVGVLKKQLDGQHLRLEEARPDLPRVLSTTIDALLSPVPEARPHSASDVVARLSGEPVRAPEPAAPRRTGPVVLPSGTHGVVVRERSNQEGRRQAMRLRRKDEHDLGEMFTLGFHHAAEQARRWMRTALELPGALPPEERLRDAVAAAAGLPSAALELPDALLDTRFTLVADVDAGTAAGLAEAARRAGFHARAQQQTSPSDSRLPIAAGAAAFLVAALIGISIASQAVSIAAVLALGVLVLILVLGAWVLDRQLLLMSPVREPLRVAYGRDLAPHTSRPPIGHSRRLRGPPIPPRSTWVIRCSRCSCDSAPGSTRRPISRPSTDPTSPPRSTVSPSRPPSSGGSWPSSTSTRRSWPLPTSWKRWCRG